MHKIWQNFHVFWPDEQSLRPNKVGMTKNNEESHFLVIIRGSKNNQKSQSSEFSLSTVRTKSRIFYSYR
jgi:hypothetical protein